MEDPITLYEVLDLITNTSGQLDSLFNYWISASFAVIVSSYLGKEHFNFLITLCISVLYILASIMFALRFYAMLDLLLFYQESIFNQLPERLNTTAPYIAYSRMLTFGAGFFVTEYYLWYSFHKVKNSDASWRR